MEIYLLLIWLAVYFILAGLGVNLGYHRILTHRSLTVPLWLERLFVTLGLPAGTPVQWVGNHRFHHKYADTPVDPHSPLHGGFLHAHVGWYIGTTQPLLCSMYALGGPFRMLFDAWHRPRSNQQFNYLAQDVAQDRYYSWLSKPFPYMFVILLHLFGSLWIAWMIAGGLGMLSHAILLVVLYNLGDSIDSVAHLKGMPVTGEKSQAKNNTFLGFLALGEGWHANHHRHPECARHGIEAGQFDFIWQVIKVLKRMKLASEVVERPFCSDRLSNLTSDGDQ